MRIVHYYPSALRGEFGTANSVREWCRALAGVGVQVALAADSKLVALPPPEGVEFLSLRRRFWMKSLVRSGDLSLRDADALVLHGGWNPEVIVAARAARRQGVPYIVVPHGVYDSPVLERHVWRKRIWWKIFEKDYLDRAKAIHLFFDRECDQLRALGVKTPCVLAPNGYEAPTGLAWNGATEDGYLLWLGRFDLQQKGIDLLIEAVSKLPANERPRVRLVGVDWKRQKAKAMRIVDKFHMNDWISVEGPVYGNEKWKLLAESRGFLYPSRWEGSPFSVVEAISIGIPTLVTPFELGRYLASHGAVIMTEPNVDSLIDGLSRLLAPESARVGRRGAEVIREQLSWERLAQSWVSQIEPLFAANQ